MTSIVHNKYAISPEDILKEKENAQESMVLKLVFMINEDNPSVKPCAKRTT